MTSIYSFKSLISPFNNFVMELTMVPNLSGTLSKYDLFFLIKSVVSWASNLESSCQYFRKVSALKSTKIFLSAVYSKTSAQKHLDLEL